MNKIKLLIASSIIASIIVGFVLYITKPTMIKKNSQNDNSLDFWRTSVVSFVLSSLGALIIFSLLLFFRKRRYI